MFPRRLGRGASRGDDLVRGLALAAAAAVAGLYVLALRASAVGAIEDDAMHILLARSLRHGAFALPDAHGTPVNDPLPGFAALLCVPAALVDPRWDLLKVIGALSALACAFFAWRLARRSLGDAWALAVAGLTVLNPLTVVYAGLVMPDLPYLALSLFLFDRIGERGALGSAWTVAVVGAATLLRPYGALLALSLGLAIGVSQGKRKAAFFLVPSLLPLAAWTLRNRFLTGAASGYVLNMSAESAMLADPRAALRHATALLAAFGGDGLLVLAPGVPSLGLAAAGAVLVVLAAIGIVRLLKETEDPRLFAVAAYLVMLAVLHAVWVPVSPRYVLPLLPLAWMLVLSGAQPYLRGRKVLTAALFGVLAALALRQDRALAAAGLKGPAGFQPKTMAWLRDNTAADARVETLEPATVSLLTGRPVEVPDDGLGQRDAWLASAFMREARFAHVVPRFPAGGFFPPNERRLAAHLEAWARSTPYAQEVFRSDEEGTVVFRLRHPDARRYLKAWAAFAAASDALKRGESLAAVRAHLDEAVALEPRLAAAWAARAALETDPREKRRLFEKAAALDPTSEAIRAALAPGAGPA